MDEKVRVLEDVARNLFANVVWTHKIQEKQAEIYEHRFKWLSVINIIFAALTSAGIVSTIFVDPTWPSWLYMTIRAWQKLINLRQRSSFAREMIC